MSRSDHNLSETDIRPPNAELTMVRADAADLREWLAKAPVCSALTHHQIRHLAVARMPSPFEIVRTKLGGSYFLACFGGEGRVLVDGRWTRCRPGHAVLLPPGTLQAFQTTPDRTWDFCWVRYQEPAGRKPLATARTPIVAKYDAEPLRLAILGLHHESSTVNGSAAINRWVDLIHHYVLRFAEPARHDPRLWQLWGQVSASPGSPWTSAEMARLVHLSEKQLQRLCQRELGRSPRQQLIWLRMSRAAELLLQGGAKIESIATQVGYQNPFVFSTTFKRVMGWSPSEYPGRK
ncbi:MAG: helix-turn-helix domain-containing protein [Planctomycetes bacterium]|nr:helix-turn-helix domain-containing protein [Planctomycetota bacterium]